VHGIVLFGSVVRGSEIFLTECVQDSTMLNRTDFEIET